MKRSGFVFLEGPLDGALGPRSGFGFDPAAPDRKLPPAAVVPSGDRYDIVHEEIPRMSRRSAGRVLGHLMKSYVPENPEEYAMDYRLRPDGQLLRATLVIIRKDLLAEIRERFPGTPLWIPPEGEGLLDPEGTAVSPGADAFSPAPAAAVRPNTPEFLDNLFFPENRRNSPFRTAGIVLLIILPFAALFGWSLLEKKESLALAEKASRREAAAPEREKIAGLEEALGELSGEWNALLSSRPASPASFFDILTREVPALEIQSVTMRGREFSLRARSADPLAVMKALSESPFFSEVNVSDIRPLQNASRKGFTLTGIYHGP